jgi:hypothetical protein
LLGTLGHHTDSTNGRASRVADVDQPTKAKRFPIMKKLHKFLAIAALTPMLAACAPSPEDLCQHVFDMAKKEAGDAAKDAPEEEMKKAMEECTKEVEKEKEKMGAAEFKKYSKCVMDAEKMEGMMKCKPEDKKEEK